MPPDIGCCSPEPGDFQRADNPVLVKGSVGDRGTYGDETRTHNIMRIEGDANRVVADVSPSSKSGLGQGVLLMV